MSIRSFAAVLLLGFSVHEEVISSDVWQYYADEDFRPVATALSLSEEPPDNFTLKVTLRGEEARYTQLRYGSEDSRRVIIVVNDRGRGSYDIYVDADRDRTIRAGELVPGEGRVRTCELATEILRDGWPQQAIRQVRLRLNATGNRINVATVGYIEGQLDLPDDGTETPVVVRRVDATANGLFADARDRLFMDLDHNGEWDPLSEQFLYLPVWKIEDRRYAVHSDRLGRRLSLTQLKGIGNLRIVARGLPEKAKLVGFEAMVFAQDGSAYSLRELNQPLCVPVGRYTLGSVTLTIDAGEKDPWHFVFSRSNEVRDEHWVTVERDADVALEAVGETRFDLEIDGLEPLQAPGIQLSSSHGCTPKADC